jgi:hypothetical protein
MINFIEATSMVFSFSFFLLLTNDLDTGTDFSIAQKNIHYTKQIVFPVYIPSSFTMVKYDFGGISTCSFTNTFRDLKYAFNKECWAKIKEILLLKTLYFTEENEKVAKSTRFAILLRISRMLLSCCVEQTVLNSHRRIHICALLYPLAANSRFYLSGVFSWWSLSRPTDK